MNLLSQNIRKLLQVILLVFIASFFYSCSTSKEVTSDIYTLEDYQSEKKDLVKENLSHRFDANPSLMDSNEIRANAYFNILKERHFDRIENLFPDSKQFIETRRFINSSPFFEKVIQPLPKGALLHGHIMNLGDYIWLADTATLYQNCYLYTGENNENWKHRTLRFFKDAPDQRWRDVAILKDALGEDFYDDIYHSITLGKDDYPYENMREKYADCFDRVDGLLRYRPLFKDYVINLLESLMVDGINYAEILSSFNGMYDTERSYLNPEQEMDLYVTIQNKIKRKHPGFDFRIIYDVSYSKANKSLTEHYKTVLKLYESYPSVLAGFNFATNNYSVEEMNEFTKFYLEIKKDPYYADLRVPFHFNPKEGDQEIHKNIYDAIMMDSKRIGYNYELYKYPVLLDKIKENHSVIEVSPISNQVLGYSHNLEDHPAVLYLNHGYPIILGANNKGVMKFEFSHQFYVAAIQWGLDLKGIKQLVLNSFKYANIPQWKKDDLETLWKTEWDKYIRNLMEQSSEMF